MDIQDITVGAFVAVCIVALAFAIFWPLDRHDDLMQRVHGDQPSLPRQ